MILRYNQTNEKLPLFSILQNPQLHVSLELLNQFLLGFLLNVALIMLHITIQKTNKLCEHFSSHFAFFCITYLLIHLWNKISPWPLQNRVIIIFNWSKPCDPRTEVITLYCRQGVCLRWLYQKNKEDINEVFE